MIVFIVWLFSYHVVLTLSTARGYSIHKGFMSFLAHLRWWCGIEGMVSSHCSQYVMCYTDTRTFLLRDHSFCSLPYSNVLCSSEPGPWTAPCLFSFNSPLSQRWLWLPPLSLPQCVCACLCECVHAHSCVSVCVSWSACVGSLHVPSLSPP